MADGLAGNDRGKSDADATENRKSDKTIEEGIRAAEVEEADCARQEAAGHHCAYAPAHYRGADQNTNATEAQCEDAEHATELCSRETHIDAEGVGESTPGIVRGRDAEAVTYPGDGDHEPSVNEKFTLWHSCRIPSAWYGRTLYTVL